MRPSHQLSAVINGSMDAADCDQAVRSQLRFEVYRRAVQVLDLPFASRRAALDSVPSTWRAMVETECVRVYKLQRGGK